MELYDKIKEKLVSYYGEYSSLLENEYLNKLITNLILSDLKTVRQWLTYNQVILELKNSFRDIDKINEIQYKITDGQNPNKVCLDVIEKVKNKNSELVRLYNKIINF